MNILRCFVFIYWMTTAWTRWNLWLWIILISTLIDCLRFHKLTLYVFFLPFMIRIVFYWKFIQQILVFILLINHVELSFGQCACRRKLWRTVWFLCRYFQSLFHIWNRIVFIFDSLIFPIQFFISFTLFLSLLFK